MKRMSVYLPVSYTHLDVYKRQGHGFAAERAEHVRDLYHGEDVKILGDNNAKNGADRLVNGVEIQSKYCRSGVACIQECFENGQYRYYSSNGEPMKIEVPADMYEDAVKAMRRRIANNEIEGVINPDEATNLVKKGHYTYAQVKQIAQAGTIESLTFDAANGMIVAKEDVYKRQVTEDREQHIGSWFIYAVLSAIFASLTAILGKIGISGIDSNLGTAIRTRCV